MILSKEQKFILDGYVSNLSFARVSKQDGLKAGDIIFSGRSGSGALMVGADSLVYDVNKKMPNSQIIEDSGNIYLSRGGNIEGVYRLKYKDKDLYGNKRTLMPCIACLGSCKLFGGKKECQNCYFCDKVKGIEIMNKTMIPEEVLDIKIPIKKAGRYITKGQFVLYELPGISISDIGFVLNSNSESISIQRKNGSDFWYAIGRDLDDDEEGSEYSDGYVQILDEKKYISEFWNLNLKDLNTKVVEHISINATTI